MSISKGIVHLRYQSDYVVVSIEAREEAYGIKYVAKVPWRREERNTSRRFNPPVLLKDPLHFFAQCPLSL
jgi:hypothetical protein